jgi:L-amino acid N-acyltransferase YncA
MMRGVDVAKSYRANVAVRSADAEADTSACTSIYRYFVEHTTSTFEYEPPSVADISARIASSRSGHEWLVAESDGQILGFAYASAWNPRPAYDWSCETTVYVRSGAEGNGVGTALYGELLNRLRTKGFHLAIGRIALPNDASVRLHESFGFSSVGVHHELGYKHGQWIDVMHTELLLDPPIT